MKAGKLWDTMKKVTSARRKGVERVSEPPRKYLPVRTRENNSRRAIFMMAHCEGCLWNRASEGGGGGRE